MGPDRFRVSTLDDEQHAGALSVLGESVQLGDMATAAGGRSVGKKANASFDEGHGLDLEPAATTVTLEAEVESAAVVTNLATYIPAPVETGQITLRPEFLDESVGPCGIQADPDVGCRRASNESNAETGAAGGTLGRRSQSQFRARKQQLDESPGIGEVSLDRFTGFPSRENDKPIRAFDEDPGDE